ncbi:HD domain-containing protein [Nocardioidaceae bacterium]|nr:HD domain-containing protein [Nocardioidaceae bacterium]
MTDSHAGLAAIARAFAIGAHAGQVDKAGNPYRGHVERVAGRVAAAGYGEEQQAAAWLHDTIEDCPGIDAALLAEVGFSPDVAAAVEALTKRPATDEQPKEEHLDAVRRACADPIAKVVKAADVADNSDPARLSVLPDDLRERLTEKYTRARALLDELGAPRFDGTSA